MYLVCLVGSIVLIWRRKLSFWLPLTGIILQIVFFVIGFHLADSIIPK